MQIKYLLFFGLFLFLLSCGSKDNDPVEPDTSKTTTTDKKEIEEKTDKKGETKETADKNTPPTATVLTAPADGATAIALNNVNLNWNASTDADGDDLTYDVYLDENNPPTTKVASDISSVSISLSGLPEHGTIYYWYVTTKDGKNDAVKSEVRSFTTINTPPTATVLTAPADGATAIALNNIDFSWDASTDADGDALTYEVYLDENNPPTTKIASNLLGETTSLTNTLENGTTYYWFVVTKDGKEGGETSSEIRSFTTINTPPTAAVLTAPADAATNVLVGHMLSWDASTDADGDDLTYDVYLDTNNPPTTKVASDVTTLSEPISLTNAPEGSTPYYWLVTTKDGKGGEINSEVRSLTTAVRPVDKDALQILITTAIGSEGNNADLGFIDTSLITDMSELFKDESNFNGDISKWNTSKVKTMESMFSEATKFNGDLSKWDVSEVTTMAGMFAEASSFNGDLSKWNTSKVKTMELMFSGATKFNGDLSKWDVSEVTDMGSMFIRAKVFNGDLKEWDVSKVTNMEFIFNQAHKFEGGDLSKWDISKVTSLKGAFLLAIKFNGDVSSWNTGNVTNMNSTFQEASNFNRELNWDVRKVTTMATMFFGAISFNKNISSWDVRNVEDMWSMFKGATSFNQNLESWNVPDEVDKSDMFDGSSLENNPPSWYNP